MSKDRLAIPEMLLFGATPALAAARKREGLSVMALQRL